jgi:flagellar biosynthetic protein FlhB
MADKPAAEKTEQPTSKKLSKARDEGQVPQSQELSSFASITVLLLVITFMAPKLMAWFTGQIRESVSCRSTVFTDSSAFMNFLNTKIIDMLLLLTPILVILLVGSMATSIFISGFTYSPNALKLKWSAISPSGGLGKLVNLQSLIKLLLSIFKIVFISILVWVYLKERIEVLAALRWAWSSQLLAGMCKLISGVVIRICIGLLVIGIADKLFQKWKYINDLKMTKEEVKEERKSTEGPPEIKRRIRMAQLQMSMKRMMQEVPKASVVLVNPTHYAVALRYDAKDMEAPVMVAKGADHMAEKIKEIATAYGVPIVRKPELTRAIFSTVKPGDPIPGDLYVAVAEVLAMIYRLRNR